MIWRLIPQMTQEGAMNKRGDLAIALGSTIAQRVATRG